MSFRIAQLTSADLPAMHGLLDVFGRAFDEADTYGAARPTAAYLERLLDDPHFVAVATFAAKGAIVGGLAAYELVKFEQERSEIYIYDLAVAAEHRRQGVATALIKATAAIARARGAHALFVQADYPDAPAVALYSKLGRREEVLHFDIDLG